jgi:hypothetical protein
VFQKGSGVTGVTLNNLDLHMMNYLGSAAIFDDPTTFTINNGRIFSSIAQVLPTAFQGIYMDAVSGSLPRSNAMSIKDGITVPDAISGQANLFVDVADGSLKVIFGNGNIIVIATNP